MNIFRTIFSIYTVLQITLIFTGCETDWKEVQDADVLIYYKEITNQEKNDIQSILSSFSDSMINHRITESNLNEQFTVRIRLKSPEEFIKSDTHKLMRKAIEEVKLPTDYIYKESK